MQLLVNMLIFSLPFGVILRMTPISNVSIYPYDLFAGLILLSVLFRVFVRREKIREKKLFIIISLFLLVGFISLLINIRHLTFQTFLISFAYSLRYAAFASIIFAFQFLDRKFKESINLKLIAAGTIFTITGYIQYFFYPNLRNLYYLGWDEHLYRFFSTFLDPNFAGAFLVLVLVLLSENIIERSAKKNRKIFTMATVWVITLVAIFFTYSRSAMVLLLTASAVFLIIHKLYKVAVIALFILVISFFIFPNPNIQGLNPLRIASIEARIESAQDALEIISKNSIIGVGFNAYRYARIRYGLADVEGTLVSNSGAGTDNSYLFVMATTGIVGIVVFVLFWINILKYLARSLHLGIYERITFVSIVGLLVNTIFINSLFYPPIMAWVFILIGFTVNRKR